MAPSLTTDWAAEAAVWVRARAVQREDAQPEGVLSHPNTFAVVMDCSHVFCLTWYRRVRHHQNNERMEVAFKVEEVINRLNDKATSSQELEQEWHDVARKLQAWTAALGIINGQPSSSRKFTRRLDMSSHLLKAVETLLSGILELLSDIPGADVVLDEADTETGTEWSRRTLSRASSGSDDSDENVDILLE